MRCWRCRIKGFFFSTEDQKDSPTELAFKYAVYRINKNREILPNHNLVYDIQVWCFSLASALKLVF